MKPCSHPDLFLKKLFWKYVANHSSIINIKNHIDSPATRFETPTAKIEDINKIIKNINSKKVTDPDKIPLKNSKAINKHYRWTLYKTISVILSQIRQKLQQFDQSIKRKVATKLKITDQLA